MIATRKVAFPCSPFTLSVRLWTYKGHRLMTHAPAELSGVMMPGKFCVSEETTGYRLPGCWGMTEADADNAARVQLDAKGDQLPGLLARLPVLNP